MTRSGAKPDVARAWAMCVRRASRPRHSLERRWKAGVVFKVNGMVLTARVTTVYAMPYVYFFPRGGDVIGSVTSARIDPGSMPPRPDMEELQAAVDGQVVLRVTNS